jgi:hypothetical protein
LADADIGTGRVVLHLSPLRERLVLREESVAGMQSRKIDEITSSGVALARSNSTTFHTLICLLLAVGSW